MRNVAFSGKVDVLKLYDTDPKSLASDILVLKQQDVLPEAVEVPLKEDVLFLFTFLDPNKIITHIPEICAYWKCRANTVGVVHL